MDMKGVKISDFLMAELRSTLIGLVIVLVWNGIAWIVNSIKNNNHTDIEGEE
jgi:hypothetical protein